MRKQKYLAEQKSEKEKAPTEQRFGPGAPGPEPVNLQIEAAVGRNNAWVLTLLSAAGETIAQMELVGNSVLPYLRKKDRITLKEFPEKVVAGMHPLKPDFTLKGPLLTNYASRNVGRERDKKLAAQRGERKQQPRADGPVPSQAEVMAKLIACGQQAVRPANGHPSVKMTAIKLDDEQPLMVGGQARSITHLYTQTVEQREIRCYLGTATGAYQRVHTSLTRDEPMTAHTMVQTGKDVAVPGWWGRGTRVGFDSVEKPGEGLRARDLTYRPARQSTVNDELIGEDFLKLSEPAQKGALRLADDFNEVLDRVFRDVMAGGAEEREATGTTVDFVLLDREWIFPDGTPATPEEEWLRSPGS
jgi:hypothetical protein